MLLAAVAVAVCLEPKLEFIVVFLVGTAGIVLAVTMWSIYRISYRTKQTLFLGIAAIVAALLGGLLMTDRFFPFMPIKYLVAAQLVLIGTVVLLLGLYLKKNDWVVQLFGLFRPKNTGMLWLGIVIGGSGTAAAGLLGLWCVAAATVAECIALSVVLLRPVVSMALQKQKEKQNEKVITIRERDIEVIESDADEHKEQ